MLPTIERTYYTQSKSSITASLIAKNRLQHTKSKVLVNSLFNPFENRVQRIVKPAIANIFLLFSTKCQDFIYTFTWMQALKFSVYSNKRQEVRKIFPTYCLFFEYTGYFTAFLVKTAYNERFAVTDHNEVLVIIGYCEMFAKTDIPVTTHNRLQPTFPSDH